MSKKHRRPSIGTKQNLLRKAIALHQSGRLEEAEEIYRGLATDDAEATQLLGVVCFQTSRRDEGMRHLERALKLDPNHVEALCNLGVAYHELGNHLLAIELIGRAVSLQPSRADLLDRKGFILQELDRHPEAIECFKMAINVDSNEPDIWFHLGNSHLALKELAESEVAFRETLRLRPEDSDTLSNLGSIKVQTMEPEAAVELLERSIASRPTAEAYFNLSTALASIGSKEKALRNARLATQLKPKSAQYQMHLGRLHLAFMQTEEASLAFQKAAELGTEDEIPKILLATTLNQQGGFATALEALASIENPSAGAQLVKALLLPPIPNSRQFIEERREATLDAIHKLRSSDPAIPNPSVDVGLTTFPWSYHSETERPLQEALSGLYKAASPSLYWESPYVGKKRTGKLRIGVLSSFLHRHTIGKLFRRLIEGISDDDLEVVLFSIGNNVDDWTKGISSNVDHFHRILGDLPTAREIVANQRLDALFYPEIGMDAFTYYLAHARLAPLQFMTWGHPVSTGIDNVDAFLSSAGLERDGSELDYTERLIKLPSLMTDFERPQPRPYSRSELGLPENRRIYTCPQTLFKIHPDMDEVFAEILSRDQDAIIVLLEGSEKHWSRLILERFKKKMGEDVDRVLILPRLNQDEYIGLCGCADVVLDTFYFGGGNSSLEAFSVGAPIVTLPGTMLRGRITLSLYESMEMGELIARDPAHYVELAIQVANESSFHRDLKDKILARNSVLYGNPKPVMELKDFLKRECRK